MPPLTSAPPPKTEMSLRAVSQIEWSTWTPTDCATLTFIIREGQVLLIRKKRGLGAGKINGPGGKLEKNETLAECAVREVEEEVGLTPTHLESRGDLRFQFLDGYAIHVHVFVATTYTGQLCETEEAFPIWFRLGDIPYSEMWEDDRFWLPHVLDGQSVRGDCLFDNDTMIDHQFEPFS